MQVMGSVMADLAALLRQSSRQLRQGTVSLDSSPFDVLYLTSRRTILAPQGALTTLTVLARHYGADRDCHKGFADVINVPRLLSLIMI